MSYESGQPHVYLLQIETGQRELVGNFPGMTFAPRFSPDGQKVIMSLLRDDGNSNIFAMDLQEPHDDAADQLDLDRHLAVLFARRQPGRVHLRPRRPRRRSTSMDADGSDQTRISFGDGVYSTPVWSPRGDLIAFTKQSGGEFQIGVMQHRRLRRAHPVDRFPAGRADLGAERARADVLPRSRRLRRAAALFDRPDRPQRAGDPDRQLRVGPGLVAAARIGRPTTGRLDRCRNSGRAAFHGSAAFWPHFRLGFAANCARSTGGTADGSSGNQRLTMSLERRLTATWLLDDQRNHSNAEGEAGMRRIAELTTQSRS